MPKNKSDTRALRKLAEEVAQGLADAGELAECDRDDVATSLVRQWLTYDGSATLFLGDRQFYVTPGITPLGRLAPTPQAAPPGWTTELTEDWKISTDDLPDIFDQLNRGQSAEVTNSDGVPLRLWVNPREKSRGVEELVKQYIPAGAPLDYEKIATRCLERSLGIDVEPDELEALAASVAKQWAKYDGHASIFLETKQLIFTLTKHESGGHVDTIERPKVSLEPLLCTYGFAPEKLREVIARINLGQEIDFRDKDGVPSTLWHDPKTLRICVRKAPGPRRAGSKARPLFCPQCSAVLKRWRDDDRQQICPHCGHTVLV